MTSSISFSGIELTMSKGSRGPERQAKADGINGGKPGAKKKKGWPKPPLPLANSLLSSS
jgi:hypothetical protein